MGGAPETLPILSNAAQVHALSPEEAARGYPVRLQGVVTFCNQERDLLFIQTASRGIYIYSEDRTQKPIIETGQILTVEGFSHPGEFSPIVRATRLQIVGKGPLPEPRRVSFERMITGQEAGQWIEVDGIVRSVTEAPATGMLTIEMATGGGRLRSLVRDFNQESDYAHDLVDAKVRIRGVCTTMFNQSRQLFNVQLLVPSMAELFVDESPPEPLTIPVSTASSLMRFAPEGAYGRRVRVQGVVTFQQTGRSLFIRDETQALLVETAEVMVVQPGDRVDVLGFPARGEWTPVLRDATFRKVGTTLPPLPLPLTVEQVLKGTHNGDLIQLEAAVLDRVLHPTEEILVLQSGNLIFNAQLEKSTGKENLALFSKGSRVRLAGICQVHLGNQRWPQTFHLILRSPADIIVVKESPWWTLQRVFWILGALTAVFLAAIIWVIALRGRVAAQTAIIRGKIQREAVLEERTRLAREFHDTLEQKLSGIGLQIESATDMLYEVPAVASQCLATAGSMIRYTQSEARRSVWDLRSHALENGDLGAAISETIGTVRNSSSAQIQMSITGICRRLPVQIENDLLRVAQEALSNALRHAQAKSIQVELHYRDKDVHLQIGDDGQGFNAIDSNSIKAGHFGLLGMHERANKLGGKLSIASAPGAGTTIELTVALDKSQM